MLQVQLLRDSWNQTQGMVSWVFAVSGQDAIIAGHTDDCLWMCRSLRGPGHGIMLGFSKFSYWLTSQFLPLRCIVCCCSITQSCQTLFDPMVCSTPGLSVLHHLPKCAQVNVHCVSDAIQPSHPLTPSSPLSSTFPACTISNLKFSLTLTHI